MWQSVNSHNIHKPLVLRHCDYMWVVTTLTSQQTDDTVTVCRGTHCDNLRVIGVAIVTSLLSEDTMFLYSCSSLMMLLSLEFRAGGFPLTSTIRR